MGNTSNKQITTQTDENGADISRSSWIKCIKTFPKSNWDIRNVYKTGRKWKSGNITKDIRKKEVYVIFDTTNTTISSVSITIINDKYRDDHVKEPPQVGTIKIYTSDQYNENTESNSKSWNLLDSKKKVKKDEIVKFNLQTQHEKLIKIAISNIHKKTNHICIGNITWTGTEAIIKDEITDKINVYQTSNWVKNKNINKILFNQSPSSWDSDLTDNDRCFIIFDCYKYEIDRIHMVFSDEKRSKPEIIKLRFSTVPNAYSFRIPSIKTYQFESFNTNNRKDWDSINLLEEIQIPNNIYKDAGFHRYLQLEFCKYMKNALTIVNFRFFGKMSDIITANSLQFDSILDRQYDANEEKYEEKKDDTIVVESKGYYKPKVVNNTPAHNHKEQDPIDNIWDDGYSYFFIQIPGFIVIDLGNNEVDEIRLTSHFQFGCKKVEILTSDDYINNNWNLLYKNDQHHIDDGKIYNISNKHNKYLKLEFDDKTRLDVGYYGFKQIELFGKSEFLKQRITTTIEDIKNMKIIDKDMVQKYIQKHDEEIRMKTTQNIYKHDNDPDYNEKGFDEKWIEKNMNSYMNNVREMCFKQEALAYIEPTIFEQEEMLKIMNMKCVICEEYALKIVQSQADDNKQEKECEDKLKETEEKRNAAKYGENVDQEMILLLTNEYNELLNKYRNKWDYFNKTKKVIEERDKKAASVYRDKSNENVYECWKESIEHNSLVISNKYNISDYESMIKWANKNKRMDMKQLWLKLINLFEQSLNEKKILLHKYFLFVVSGQSLDFEEIKAKKYKPIWILFDCGDRNIKRVEFKLEQDTFSIAQKTHKIEFYSADEITERKVDVNGDMETEICWDNFNIIGTKEFDYKNDNDDSNSELNAKYRYITFSQSKFELTVPHKKYLRIVFLNKMGLNPRAFKFDQIKFFVEIVDDKNEMDEDEKNGIVENKFRLQHINALDPDIFKQRFREFEWGAFENVYVNNDACYESPVGMKNTYIIFDSEDKKIQKIETKYADNFNGHLKSFSISTSDNYSSDNKDNNKWTELYSDEIKDSKTFNANYIEQINVADIGCKNQRYLKLSFKLHDDGNCFKLINLRFITVDVDTNIKNLSSTIKVINCTPCHEEHVIDNIYNNVYRQFYRPRDQSGKSYKVKTQEIIRDEVCRALNQIHNGGKISNQEKHFVKFLLCWKNYRFYDEILLTSKRIMNILSKPLILEYKKLQEINSKLLSLKLDEKYGLPSNIVSNHVLLEFDYLKWYSYRKAFFYPDDLNKLAEEWINLGLQLSDKEFKHLRKNGILDTEKSFVSADELAMEYLNLIAQKLDPSFQKQMRLLFESNRRNLDLLYPTKNVDLGVLSGPIKTKARQNVKIKIDYYDKPTPQVMSVLDIVRCAIVCENDNELCNLFDLIMKEYSGKILRVKNAFDSVNKGTYGYRAVLINIAYGDETILPKKYEMICEIQLLLLKYYQVRKDMHLGYGIVRSEEGGLSSDRRPFVVLAEDSCKLGKLDI